MTCPIHWAEVMPCSVCAVRIAEIAIEAAADGEAWRKHRLTATRELIAGAARAKHQAKQEPVYGRKLSPKLASQKASEWRRGER